MISIAASIHTINLKSRRANTTLCRTRSSSNTAALWIASLSDKALTKAIAALGPGDVLLVTRLDRLARSTRDLLNILDAVSKAGAKFKSLADAWADTTTPHGELMITILAGLATFERHLIRARTDEGRKRAQARGVRFGRPLKLTAFQINEAVARREAGEALADIGRSYGVSHPTISRLCL
jgi:DNA invertase Pin-like site-specific DNA recombinase